jgi:hypothetical protein
MKIAHVRERCWRLLLPSALSTTVRASRASPEPFMRPHPLVGPHQFTEAPIAVTWSGLRFSRVVSRTCGIASAISGARSGESWRARARARTLTQEPDPAETEEREAGGRVTETESRFTDGENTRTPLRGRSRRGERRHCSRIPRRAVNRDGRARLERSLTVLTFSLAPVLNSGRVRALLRAGGGVRAGRLPARLDERREFPE